MYSSVDTVAPAHRSRVEVEINHSLIPLYLKTGWKSERNEALFGTAT